MSINATDGYCFSSLNAVNIFMSVTLPFMAAKYRKICSYILHNHCLMSLPY